MWAQSHKGILYCMSSDLSVSHLSVLPGQKRKSSQLNLQPLLFWFSFLNQSLSDMLLDLSDLLQVSFKTFKTVKLKLELLLMIIFFIDYSAHLVS